VAGDRAAAGGILVVGEALIDEVRHGDGTAVPYPGGSPFNVAIGLARLGARAALLTRLGADEYGDLLRAALDRDGVALAADPVGTTPTSVAAASIDAAGVASYDFSISWELPDAAPDLLGDFACVHTGSLATALEPGASAVLRLLDRAHVERIPVSYDPNLRPSLLGSAAETRPAVQALVARSDVVKVSVEDLAWLEPGVDAQDVARRWLGAGAAIVVVTRGAEGSYAVTRTVEIELPAVPVQLVDTVGAGDAFTAGLLDGLRRAQLLGPDHTEALHAIDEPTLRQVLDRAALVAAITCSRPGADPPHADHASLA
jgi:fructokinase